jgi:hypothetical protein
MDVNLTGNYRGTDEEVSYKDKILRETAIPILEKILNCKLISNPNVKGIDLLYTDRKGGIELEAGKWIGHYMKQNFNNYNQFTLKYITFNIPQRKEKYFKPKSNLISRAGKPYIHYEPDFMFNSFARFNSDFTQFWYINAEMFLKEGALLRGKWKTNTVTTGDIEDWLCFLRDNVEIYNLKNGDWIKEDKTYIINDPVYKNYLDRYRREFHTRENQTGKDVLSE